LSKEILESIDQFDIIETNDKWSLFYKEDPYKNISLKKHVDISGWHTSSETFEEILDCVSDDFTIIEVGSFHGQSAIYMANHFKKKKFYGTIWCVDTFLGSIEHWKLDTRPYEFLEIKNGRPEFYIRFLENVKNTMNNDMILPLPQTSSNAAKLFKRENIKADLIYIDGSHEFLDVMQDLTNYNELLAEGRLMFGDDWGMTDVFNAVCQFASVNDYLISCGDTNHWILHKEAR
jgi:cephalosporin hydroxylase